MNNVIFSSYSRINAYQLFVSGLSNTNKENNFFVSFTTENWNVFTKW